MASEQRLRKPRKKLDLHENQCCITSAATSVTSRYTEKCKCQAVMSSTEIIIIQSHVSETSGNLTDEKRHEGPDLRAGSSINIPTVNHGGAHHISSRDKLLSSAGDSFAQFRFAEEKEWEVEVPSSKQISPLFVDCQSLAQSLQELPLYLRLNVEAELVQITPPAELPQMRMMCMHDALSKFSQFRAQATAVDNIPVNSVPGDPGKNTFSLMLKPVTQAPENAPPASQQPPDKLDEELDFLLQLETPVSKSNDIFLKGAQDVEVLCDPGTVNTSTDSSGADMTDSTNSQAAETVKKLNSEEELEDWLDSMIS
ncbi:cell death regulator Aven-like [Heterodontus francisci]|uniref:cell death regulator Aven-like n=1 Tax=Heterodontus francisci TaxID=7792 RepID=UPI00355BBFE5